MTERRRPARRYGAGFGLFAVLFQAILFGWHHHDLTFAGRLAVPVVEKPVSAPLIAGDQDSCEICQVLHRLTATPVAFVTAPPSFPAAAAPSPEDAAWIVHAAARAFRARAPPLA